MPAATATATDAINVGTFTLANGSWMQNTAALPAFHATDFRIQGGSVPARDRRQRTSANPYQITDVYGLQGIGSSTNLLGQQLSSWPTTSTPAARRTGTAARASSRSATTMSFSGIFDGQDFTINGLTINPDRQWSMSACLATWTTARSAIVNLTNVNITGNTDGQVIGGLVGATEPAAAHQQRLDLRHGRRRHALQA